MLDSSARSGRTTDEVTLSRAELLSLIKEHTQFRSGIGYDVHRFAEGPRLVLGGVEIPYERGLLGHSDADVITHAAMDACLGAAGCADIGTYFPDTDAAYKGADSIELAKTVRSILEQAGFELESLDLMVVAEAPKLKPHIPAMKEKLAAAFGIDPTRLGLKATTNEQMGWVGRGEGIACLASALVRKVPGTLVTNQK